jgi:hypothetical protein
MHEFLLQTYPRSRKRDLGHPAFDPRRNAILLVAGDKSGVSEKTFYKRLIDKADKRYKDHLETLETKE